MNNLALPPGSLIWLAECSVRISIVAVAVLVVAQILQRRSAVVAHRICVTAFIVLPLMAVTHVLPSWALPSDFTSEFDNVHQPAELANTTPPDASIEVPEATQPKLTANEVTQQTRTTGEAAAGIQPVAQNLPTTKHVIRQTDLSLFEHFPLASTLQTIWLLIAIFLCLRMMLAIARLLRLLKQCSPASIELQERVQRTALQLGIRNRFQVRLSQQGTMPFVSWLGGWSVVLPTTFKSWNDEEQAAVLTHELGHVARRDCIANLIVRAICCIAWPHVFLQLLRAMIGRLREPACDEWAVTFGSQDASTYGTALLGVVSRCQPVTSPLVTSVAGPGQLESRVLRLAAWRPQHSVPRLAFRRLTSAMVVCLTVAVATAQQQTTETVQPTPTVEQSAPKTDAPTISFRGSVVTADGSPVDDALVFVQPHYMSMRYGVRMHYGWSARVVGHPVLIGRSATQADGAFSFDKLPIPPHLSGVATAFERGESGAALFVWAGTRGFAYTDLQALNSAKPLELRLRHGVIATGMVVDENGQPIAGATVNLGSMSRTNERPEITALALHGEGQQIPLSVMTNDAGIFEFGGLPSYFYVRLSISAPGFTTRTRFGIRTETGNVGIRSPDNVQETFQIQKLYRIPLRRERLLKVRVVDDKGVQVKTGQIAVLQNRSRLQSSHLMNNGTISFDLNKCRNDDDFEIVYSCDPQVPRPGMSVTTHIADWEQSSKKPIELRLPKPRWATGQVLDAATNKAIPRQFIYYTVEGTYAVWSSCVSGDDGTFQLAVLGGKGRLRSRVSLYDSPTFQPEPLPIDIPDDGEGQPITMHLSHGRVIYGRVTDIDGLAASNVVVSCGPESLRTDETGHFKFKKVSPFSEFILTAWSDQGGISQLIAAADANDWPRGYDTPLDLELHPGVTLEGRVIRDGQSVPNVGLDIHVSIPGDTQPFQFAHTVRTNSDGVYQIRGLLPGQGFRLKARGDEIWHWKYDKPYWPAIDVGETRTTVTLPAAWIGNTNQPLAGTVIDDSETPLADVTVQACWSDGARLTHQDCEGSPTTQTDAEGRFSLKGLPNAPLLLRAIADPVIDGGEAQTREVLPTRNASEITITIDHSDGN